MQPPWWLAAQASSCRAALRRYGMPVADVSAARALQEAWNTGASERRGLGAQVGSAAACSVPAEDLRTLTCSPAWS